MPATGLLSPKQQYFDNDGHPAAGWFLYTYAAGTDTPVDTFTNAGLSVANENPIELDASGRAVIYVDPDRGALKLVMHDADDVMVWTQDAVSAAEVAT